MPRDARDWMKHLAMMLDKELPEETGFALFVFPFNEPEGRSNYIANANREDVIKTLKSMIKRWEEVPESWGDHV